MYLVGAREVMEQEIPPVTIDRAKWPMISPTALPPESAGAIASAAGEREAAARSSRRISGAIRRRSSSSCGCAQRLGIGVLESVPNHLSFPHDHPLYQGSQWNEKRQNVALAEADVILVVDSDVPWIPQINRPSAAMRRSSTSTWIR